MREELAEQLKSRANAEVRAGRWRAAAALYGQALAGVQADDDRTGEDRKKTIAAVINLNLAHVCLKAAAESDTLPRDRRHRTRDAQQALDRIDPLLLTQTQQQKLDHRHSLTAQSLAANPASEHPDLTGTRRLPPGASEPRSPALHVRRLPHKGRALFTSTPLAAGDVLLRERAFASILAPTTTQENYLRCHECLDESWAPLPCPNCPRVFCSTECHAKANHWHLEACPATPPGSEVTPLKPSSLRQALAARVASCLAQSDPSCDATTLDTVRPRSDPDPTGILGLQHSSNQTEGDEDMKEDDDDDDDGDKASAVAVHQGSWAQSHAHLPSQPWWQSAKCTQCDLTTVTGLRQHLLRVLRHNQHGLAQVELQPSEQNGEVGVVHQVYGAGLFVHGSLFNHSCVPNVHLHFHGDELVATASKPIPANSELTISYGPLAVRDAWHAARQTQLRNTFNFACQCIACAPAQAANLFPSARCIACGQPLRVTGASFFSLKLLQVLRPRALVQATSCSVCGAAGMDAVDLPALVQDRQELLDLAGVPTISPASRTTWEHEIKTRCHALASQYEPLHPDLLELFDAVARRLAIELGDAAAAKPWVEQTLAIVEHAYGQHSREAAEEHAKLASLSARSK
ncbi:uncharacterized protein MONBRDRAFT_36878 [Monosiga brevicollis MX1]|uniref:SET domain-containing protein n=1 Tax=Monosiga brevicollis TaxID=81824 RepID=A9UXH1_MONBE|nr:uncharacterized protein MONBRDRAFT_36878 [Monosiga brevicollis MX1]EDQ89843.1 predicted protein [Monosiga brevicollis MX1]|eukprot:XP_001745265.1 hypothetical protein [Monosiga brevicollis MX1]